MLIGEVAAALTEIQEMVRRIELQESELNTRHFFSTSPSLLPHISRQRLLSHYSDTTLEISEIPFFFGGGNGPQ